MQHATPGSGARLGDRAGCGISGGMIPECETWPRGSRQLGRNFRLS